MAAQDFEKYLEKSKKTFQLMHVKLTDFLKRVVSSMIAMLKPLMVFVKQVQKNAKALIGKIGKSAVNTLLSLPRTVETLVLFLKDKTVSALGFVKKLMAAVKKVADPKRTIKALKSLVARFAKVFREIVTKLIQFVAALNPLNAVLSIVNTFVTMLRFIMSWISQVTGILKLSKKTLDLAKKSMKALKKELGVVTGLVKETNALKAA